MVINAMYKHKKAVGYCIQRRHAIAFGFHVLVRHVDMIVSIESTTISDTSIRPVQSRHGLD